MKQLLLAFTFFLSLNFAHAQDSDTGNWFIYFGNQAINKKWNWHNEVQYRNYNFAGDMQQLLLRTGIGYNLTENNNNILLGYGFINSENYIPGTDNKLANHEHRIYQQFITRQNFGRIYLQHRYRVEERFLENDFQVRFRYFLALNVPINKPKMEDKAFYLSAYNEIFLNAESPTFDRDRLYGALGYVINKNFRVEAGFMRQIQEKTGRNQFQIVIYNNIPFKSAK
ncbi:DUF2490 domain-containing protein [Flavobacterium sp. GA093]|uniref:DUF2490 domain-containing protein n=1 Tax=Flavobacterium hydrocarbonoxydans TaxID=2683249 RepID=A0A6I4NT18_9FLAO|nr:DUF2490 domain-containing protein [Flavobacterium hydrocarbonoxydans]MWB96192.1 DUF2490 domain-containing protein [Flavobacterium hydrocarbonoxydans]